MKILVKMGLKWIARVPFFIAGNCDPFFVYLSLSTSLRFKK